MKTHNLKIGALQDPQLAQEVQKTLEAQRGVRTATVRPGQPGGAEVEYDEKRTSVEQLVATLRQEGYDAAIGG